MSEEICAEVIGTVSDLELVGAYRCRVCAYRSKFWTPRCPSRHCRAINAMFRFASDVIELDDKEIDDELDSDEEDGELPRSYQASKVKFTRHERIGFAGLEPLNRVLDSKRGKGAVVGSFYVVCGEPGGGKSTLLLKAAIASSKSGLRVSHLDSEEPMANVIDRAYELGASKRDLSGLFVVDSADYIEDALERATRDDADIVVINSIQEFRAKDPEGIPLLGAPGDPQQLKRVSYLCMRYAHKSRKTVFAVSQIKSDGEMLGAGNRVLHRSDATLRIDRHPDFENEGSEGYKQVILSSVKGKNRHSDDTVKGIFRRSGADLVPVGVLE